MSEPLQVDPIDLFVSSDHLAMHQAQHLEVHEAANTNIEAAGSGWIGSSAAALHGKFGHLQEITSHISNELQHHRDAFTQAGHSYKESDHNPAGGAVRVRVNL